MTTKLGIAQPPATELLRLAVCSARAAARLSQLRAALDVRCDKDTLASWERGDTRPDVAKLLDAPKLGPHFRAALERLLQERRAA